MKNSIRKLSIFCLVVGIFLVNPAGIFPSPEKVIHEIQLNDATINPATAEYIISSIDYAQKENAVCLIIKMDTPGGLLTSTRSIVKKMLTSDVPVVVYIAPSGSRAGSAGVFITYASHIAAMAPSTNIGAAHPVNLGGQSPKGKNDWEEIKQTIRNIKDKDSSKQEEKTAESHPEVNDDPMQDKILNDTVAFIRAIAIKRGRNEDWAVKSVTESQSIPETEALEKGVIDIIAQDESDLIRQINGRTVSINGQDVTLDTENAEIKFTPLDFRQNLFNILANPNIAYFLMILGFYGLLFEVTHPGFGVPGILGAIFLILAFYSMQTLPTNYAGVALLGLGLILFIVEAFVPGFGLFAFGGLISMILGSLFLFESADPIMQVSRSVIFGFSFATATITLLLVRSVIRAHNAKALGGKEGIIGEIGKAQTDIAAGSSGKVFVHGELWTASSAEPIKKDDSILVQGITELKLKVTKTPQAGEGKE